MTESRIKTVLNIKREFEELSYSLDERRIRLWCAARSRSYDRDHGRGGITLVHEATGVSRPSIYAGIAELESDEKLAPHRIRKSGGGRKKITETHPDIMKSLDSLVDPESRGDPESPLRWTRKSTTTLAEELVQQGYQISSSKVGELLSDLDYSLQSNKKTKEGSHHPDRNEQFEYINEQVKQFQAEEQPVISVDTKKKENLGNFKNSGQEWRPKKQPRQVNAHDFPDKERGKVVPYGIYDIQHNQGWVSVGINNDTAEFAVNTIRTWYHKIGNQRYPHMNQLMITADCGGSNGYRVRLWKKELQQLSNDLGLSISVCHYPPGTSKWNKIEHRMFSFISQNWKGQPLIDRQTVIELIGNTTTQKGLEIQTELDEKVYQKGIKVSDAQMNALNIEKHTFHGEWNYTIHPQNKA